MQSAKLLEVIPQTSDTQTLKLDVTFPFKPGQAVAILLPGDPKQRYYSISSSPTETTHTAVTIKAPVGTPLYESLFKLAPGETVEISEPTGSFVLPENWDGAYYFVSGGSGVTPFRSMIKYLLDSKTTHDHWLFHSVRSPEDLIFKDEFLKWGETKNFHYVPTFTRSSEALYGGEVGRIGDKMLQRHLPMMEGTFFLCGPQAFVNDMELLLENDFKIPAERIQREKWETPQPPLAR